MTVNYDASWTSKLLGKLKPYLFYFRLYEKWTEKLFFGNYFGNAWLID